MSLKWIIRLKGWKEVKKEVKRLKKNKSISISRKRSLCRRLLRNRKYYRIQNITNNKKKVAWKRKPLEKKIRKKEDNNVDNKEKKKKKQQKTKCKFGGEEFLGPQASLRVTPCSPAPNHTRGEVIRPPSQIENNSYSVIRTRDLDDLSCTRCAPTIAARPSRNYILY